MITARALRALGHHELMSWHLELALARFPARQAELLPHLAYAHAMAGRPAAAAALFERAWRISGQWAFEAADQHRVAGRTEAALRLNARVPDPERRLPQRLLILTEGARFERAAALAGALERAGLLDARARYRLALSHLATGQLDRARAMARSLPEQDPWDERRQDVLDRLQACQDDPQEVPMTSASSSHPPRGRVLRDRRLPARPPSGRAGRGRPGRRLPTARAQSPKRDARRARPTAPPARGRRARPVHRVDGRAGRGRGREEDDPGSPREYDLGAEDVIGQEREATTTGASFEIELGQLQALPFKNAADVMMLAPGVLTTNHGGDGHAHETFMRGFFAGEGQDIEYTVDGVPLNEVSNPHGHGYTDLFFMPPAFIQTMRVTEGSFDPAQGDFAFAGSVDFQLGVPNRGLFTEVGYGSFDTRQLRLTWAPEGQDVGTFAGVEVYSTDGFGQNRAAERAAALARYARDPGGDGLRWAASFYGYTSRYDQAGVIRADDLEAGDIGFYETYDPSQGGESTRALATLRLTSGPNDALLDNVAWLGVRTMRLRQNFTGFLTPTDIPDKTSRSITATPRRGATRR